VSFAGEQQKMVTGLQKLSFPVLSAETSHRLATQVFCFIIYHQILVTGLHQVPCFIIRNRLAKTQFSCFISRN
jgi:hypothetical protein